MTNIISIDSTYEKAAIKQGNLHAPSKKAETYNQFWSDYENHGIENVLKRYAFLDFKSKVKGFVKNLLRK